MQVRSAVKSASMTARVWYLCLTLATSAQVGFCLSPPGTCAGIRSWRSIAMRRCSSHCEMKTSSKGSVANVSIGRSAAGREPGLMRLQETTWRKIPDAYINLPWRRQQSKLKALSLPPKRCEETRNAFFSVEAEPAVPAGSHELGLTPPAITIHGICGMAKHTAAFWWSKACLWM